MDRQFKRNIYEKGFGMGNGTEFIVPTRLVMSERSSAKWRQRDKEKNFQNLKSASRQGFWNIGNPIS